MEKIISPKVIEEILAIRFPTTDVFQLCSFINPSGKYLVLDREHHEAFKWLVTEQLVSCIPDAEEVLNELGYIRYSYIGYITLPTCKLTSEQYETLEYALYEMQKYKTSVSLQLANNPRFYLDVELEDNIDRIISMIKNYYEEGELKYVQ